MSVEPRSLRDELSPHYGTSLRNVLRTFYMPGNMKLIMFRAENVMSTVHAASVATTKIARHRERLRAAGLRPVQFWVPDTRTPEFVAQLRSQCLALKADAAEAEAIGFAEAAATTIEGWE